MMRLGQAKSPGRASASFQRFNFTIARRRVRHEGVEQALRNPRHFSNRLIEGVLVDLGRTGESAQLAHKLQGGSLNFFTRRRR